MKICIRIYLAMLLVQSIMSSAAADPPATSPFADYAPFSASNLCDESVLPVTRKIRTGLVIFLT